MLHSFSPFSKFFLISGCQGQQNKVGIAVILFITAVSHHRNYQQQQGAADTHMHNQSCVIMAYREKYLAVNDVIA